MKQQALELRNLTKKLATEEKKEEEREVVAEKEKEKRKGQV